MSDMCRRLDAVLSMTYCLKVGDMRLPGPKLPLKPSDLLSGLVCKCWWMMGEVPQQRTACSSWTMLSTEDGAGAFASAGSIGYMAEHYGGG
jgi:hypothetical protein